MPDDLKPTTSTQAKKDPKWHQIMFEEYDALVWNRTWELVPPTFTQNLVGCKWVFWTKRYFDDSIGRFQACLIAKDFHQRPRVDYHVTFSSVVKLELCAFFLNFAVSCGWSLRQLDVNNAFLQGHLFEDVYMVQPYFYFYFEKKI